MEIVSASQRAQEFNKWTNNTENVDKFDSNDKVEDFQMFDFNAGTYSKDLKEFAQANIELFDKDKNGTLDKDELIDMLTYTEEDADLLPVSEMLYDKYRSAYAEDVIPEYDKDGDGVFNKEEFFAAVGVDVSSLTPEDKAAWEELFDSINLLNYDGDKDHINADELLIALNDEVPDIEGMKMYELRAQASKNVSNKIIKQRQDIIMSNMDINKDGQIDAKEYASHLFTEDLDFNVYNMQTGDGLIEALDGKANYRQHKLYPLLSEGREYEDKEYMKNWFYNKFYKNLEE